jgi:hypothetical protein
MIRNHVLFCLILTSLISLGSCNLAFLEAGYGHSTEMVNSNLEIGESLLNVKCFWVKGFNVYDISGLEKKEK